MLHVDTQQSRSIAFAIGPNFIHLHSSVCPDDKVPPVNGSYRTADTRTHRGLSCVPKITVDRSFFLCFVSPFVCFEDDIPDTFSFC